MRTSAERVWCRGTGPSGHDPIMTVIDRISSCPGFLTFPMRVCRAWGGVDQGKGKGGLGEGCESNKYGYPGLAGS
jgi:hypothetical protein